MIRKYGPATVVISLSIVILSALLFLTNIGKISPLPNNNLITAGKLCADKNCAKYTDIALPFFVPMQYSTLPVKYHLQFQFGLDDVPHQDLAIYIPKLSDNATISLNNTTFRTHSIGVRSWNHPILSQLPKNLVIEGNNQIGLILTGPPQEGLELFPFYVGSLAELQPMNDIRTTIGVGATRFSLGLMAILFVVIGSVWLARKNDTAYLWLSLSCLIACIFLYHYGFFGNALLPYKYWTLLWALSINLYVFLIMKFICRFLLLPTQLLEKVCWWFVLLFAVVMIVAPAKYVFLLTLALNIGTAFSALSVLVIFWLNKQNSTPRDFAIFYAFLTVSLVVGAYEVLLNLLNEPTRSLHVLQFVPLAMSIVCLWLIMSQLIRGLSEFEALTDSLNDTIKQKSHELAENYLKLADAEKRRTISLERQRIMLDLHDGIGGQLVNTLAYMENNKIGDETLRTALEEALRDLALLLDTLENEDSISTQLGMLRTRLEALLEANGLKFIWQIGEEPILSISGPSQNLHLTRIVQEAITNIVKHANASEITVSTTASTVTISDNGVGFNWDDLSKNQGKHGILGMKRRAEQIGAKLEIASHIDNESGASAGSTISLTL